MNEMYYFNKMKCHVAKKLSDIVFDGEIGHSAEPWGT